MSQGLRGSFAALGLAATLALTSGCVGSPDDGARAASGDTIKVGVLHSLSGTMAISEVTVKNAELLAIEEINAAGGVLGKKLEPVVEDGASDWPTFAEKAQKLISQDRVATVFGGWTSASRKAMLPVFERNKALLWYPVQYEGLESSPYIFYTGATTNQQIVPGLDYLKEQGKKRVFLVGSDYVFPRTANKIIKAYAAANGMEIVGEEYTPLGHTEYSTVVNKLQRATPDAVFNTLNGDSNVAFFKALRGAGITADAMPTVSVSVAEEEVAGIGPDNIAGHLVAWNYYQTTTGAANETFVKAFKAKYGADKVTSDPMEAGYNAVKLWAAAAEKAGTVEVEAVKAAAKGVALDLPEGTVTIDGENQHVFKTARIGLVQPDGQIKEVWNSGQPIKPDPYLKGYAWATGLS
ncbi:urea transport system substrate-binding protein [Catenuloplanes nepalensis]|uniref:Urea transport system substrate-binding protein n=1 Tax=Catenuloplanes nepalensis TaxID=587533 RepID=A0ABT9MYF5_9ACTN|nr:urea ABC transporter substrate-binding protein [Catenuloplanes nepalensis]MDP9796276.1 urea transport system substrate-binding protein [Catenuloplanes nepalensis]